MNMIFTLPKDDDSNDPPQPEGTIKVTTYGADGKRSVSFTKMSDEFWEEQKTYQEEMKRLKEVGTPYWCIHEGREVSHPAAYWKEDGYFRDDGLEMQYKHGVMCDDCGGYIQEG
jgi:hypothetical protein